MEWNVSIIYSFSSQVSEHSSFLCLFVLYLAKSAKKNVLTLGIQRSVKLYMVHCILWESVYTLTQRLQTWHNYKVYDHITAVVEIPQK